MTDQAAADGSTSLDAPAVSLTAPEPLSPVPLSLAERDRRWDAVQDLIEQERLDGLIIADVGAASPTARYLTNVAPGVDAPIWVLVPRGGTPIAIRRIEGALAPNPWGITVMAPPQGYRPALLDLVRDFRVRHHRLGMMGVTPVGVAPAVMQAFPGTPAGLARAVAVTLPDVELMDLTGPMQRLRARKSAEEIGQLRSSVRMLDYAFAHMDQLARPGMYAHELWASGVGDVCCMSGEIPTSARWAAAARPRGLARISHSLLVPGVAVSSELAASSNGYTARAVHNTTIGACGPAVSALHQAIGQLWDGAFAAIRPGLAVTELQRQLQIATRRLAQPRGPFRHAEAWISLHGAGLGADAPRISGRNLSARAEPPYLMESALLMESAPLMEGWVFSLTVTLRADIGGRQYLASWEDPVAIASSGGIRLGSRVPGQLRTESVAP